jgi:ABC-type nitrate/sulfonate/bicarbonate transport system permease component
VRQSQGLGACRAQEIPQAADSTLSPHLFSALKIPSSLAILAAIAGDFVGATQGLGCSMMFSSAHLKTAAQDAEFE